MGVAQGVGGLLEREHELGEFDRLIADVAQRRAGLCVVEAAAGLGKSCLLAEARARAERHGLRVLSAGGRELERDFAFGVVRQLFDPLLRASDAAERGGLLDGVAGRAWRLLAASGSPAGPGDSGSGYAIVHGLYWLAANAAERGGLVLMIDDLHLADAASLRFLAFLSNRLEGLALLVLATTRPVQELERSHAAVSELCASAAAVRLRPAPLSERAVAGLVERALAGASFELACELHGLTAGNPFYLVQLLGAMREEGIGGGEVVQWLRQATPGALSRTVLVRLAALPDDCQLIAQAVSVLGDGASLADAAALAALGLERAADAADRLMRASILRGEKRLEFVHPIVREAIYGDLGPALRAERHRHAAGVLYDRGADRERVAGQLLRAAPGSGEWAVELLELTAARSLRRGAPEAGANYLRRALEEPVAGERRAGLLLAAGTAEALAHDPACVEHLRGALEGSADPRLRATAAALLARALAMSGAIDVGVELLEQVGGDVRERDAAAAHALDVTIAMARFAGGARDISGRFPGSALA